MNPFYKPCFCLILNHYSTDNKCLYSDYFSLNINVGKVGTAAKYLRDSS